MSRKRILNITSKKKKDNMLAWTNTTATSPGGSTSYSGNSAVITGNAIYCFPWIATARIGVDYVNPGTDDPNPINEAARTSDVCYMRGLKESILITTSSGQPWRWRRVCFTLKGDDIYQQDVPGYAFSLFTAQQGHVRVLNNIGTNTSAYATLNDVIFDGEAGLDWSTVFNAKLDTQRINVKYDRTRTISSGNANGILRNSKQWHPMNKNLQYADDESGGSYVAGRYSTRNEGTMGDYYIVDYFLAGLGATTDDRLAFNSEATLYWHEK